MNNNKTALVFGGQGGRFVGMNRTLYDCSSKAQDIFRIASRVTGYDVERLCFEPRLVEKKKTIYGQVCIAAIEVAIYEIFKEYDVSIDSIAGFSLGEYPALIASGVLDVENLFKLVQERSIVIDEAISDELGRMMVVEGISNDYVNDICAELGYDNVSIANYNSYNQVVLSLKKDYVKRTIDSIKYRGGITLLLDVLRPFHHVMMFPAAEKYKKYLANYHFDNPKVPLYSNVTGEEYNECCVIPDLLYKHIYSPVQWIRIIRNMLDNGIRTFYEISSRKQVDRLIYNIAQGLDISVINVQDMLINGKR